MLCNTISDYPFKIDDMIFFQDNDLKNVEIINQYESLISQGKYSEADTYIEQQENIYGYFADFFNLLENRIYSLQEHILTKQKKQPFIFHDEEENYPMGSLQVFYEQKEENLCEFLLFAETDTQESIQDILVFTGEEQAPPDADIYTIWI